VVVRSDGTPTYFLADIAYHFHKYQRGFERAIDFWGPDHHGHIQRMQCAMEALGIARDWLEVQILQQVTLLEGGKPIKMSKRAGQFVTMDELISDVGADVAKYTFLTRKPNSHLEFDLDLAKEQTEKNPVLKVKYAHARICTLLDKAEAAGVKVGQSDVDSLLHLVDDAEWNLVRELIRLPQVIVSAANSREPHRLAQYADEIAELYNHFYTKCKRILEQEEDRRAAQLQLSSITRHVIRVILDLMGIEAPEKMEKRD
jgi:arginyl-tRNA synthetase